jgi:hypothetical protein
VGLAVVRAYFEGMPAGISKVRFKAGIVVCAKWVSVCGKTSGVHSGALMGLPASGKKISVPGSAFFRAKAGQDRGSAQLLGRFLVPQTDRDAARSGVGAEEHSVIVYFKRHNSGSESQRRFERR